jgi:ribonucleotide reductase alpha subunit
MINQKIDPVERAILNAWVRSRKVVEKHLVYATPDLPEWLRADNSKAYAIAHDKCLRLQRAWSAYMDQPASVSIMTDRIKGMK